MKKRFIGMLVIMALCVGLSVPAAAKAEDDAPMVGAKTLKDKIPALSETEITIYPGETFKLTVLNIKDNMKVSWNSENNEVATVKKGKVTATGLGTTEVRAVISADGEKNELVCKVNVVIAGTKDAPEVSVKEVKKTGTVKIGNISYAAYNIIVPDVKIDENDAAAKKINKYFTNLSKNSIVGLRELAENTRKSADEETLKSIVPGNREIAASLSYANGQILCFTISDKSTEANAGSNSASSKYTSVIFDEKTGRQIKLKSMLKNEKNARAYVFKQMEKQIDKLGKQYGTDIKANPLYAAVKETLLNGWEDGNWSVDGKNFIIHFTESELGLPVSGGIDFEISLSNLYKYLSSTGRRMLFAGGKQNDLVLSSNPSTGYSWSYTESRKGYLEIIEKYTANGEKNLMGAPGTQTFSVKGVKKGTVTVTYEYLRSWEGTPVKTVTVVYYVDKDLNVHVLSRKEKNK